MLVKIPFNESIDFRNNISEITSISLEHDYNVNDGVLLGNFYVSGEYRTHEVSVNTEKFEYTLPFSLDLDEDIKYDTLTFNIEDFKYDIEDSKLNVNILYSINAEVYEKEVDEEEIDNIIEEFTLENDSNESLEREEINEEDILKTANNSNDTFVTYHVHIVKENETMETISVLYNIPLNIINEYNNIESLSIGDKIIIPSIEE